MAIKLPDELKATIGPSVANALSEDIGSGDLTAALVDADDIVGASIIARQSLVLSGHPFVDEVFSQLGDSVVIDWYIGDGQSAEADDVVCKLVGPARTLLTGERTALNFLQTLSATATTTSGLTEWTTRCRRGSTTASTVRLPNAATQPPRGLYAAANSWPW